MRALIDLLHPKTIILHDSIYAGDVLNMITLTNQGANIQISKMIDPKTRYDLLSLKDMNHYTVGFDGINALNTYLKAGATNFSQVRALHF
jgi:phage-related minor tail protein